MDASQQTLLERWGISGPTAYRSALAARARAGELTPTWQTGREVQSPYDVKRFATEGYSQNSLIYACIQEKATSFAALPPQMTRPNGELDDNRVVQLLRNPNAYQDGAEFAEEIATHWDVAGNVYIAKVRESATPERIAAFGTFPVQEIQAIRPDKVTIEPGARRRDDVYVIKIDGRVRMRIPRRDMIHIKRPNMLDDLYGLSPLALLAREGTIDLTLADFNLAFFRNAGVPAGLLTVKGRTSPEQTEEIKSSFRRAYSGIRKWFEVLVLNADVTDYKQLALPQNAMGLEETRFHNESRICSVLGVPGQLVGARFALNASASAVYEQNQFQFWSETMVPLSRRFASAFQEQLFLADFATRQTVRNELGYDYSGVRALQEDNSRKMREVVRLVNSGGVTVEAAFKQMGLEPPPDSNFYVRSGNQAAVYDDGRVVLVESSGDQTPEAPNPLEGAARLRSLDEADEIVRQAFAQRRIEKTVRFDDEGRVIGTLEEHT